MKKNKKLDKIINKAVTASIKNQAIDESKVALFSKSFKNLSLTDAVYALTQYKKGLADFINKHTMTISAPVELPQEIINKIKTSVNSTLDIRHLTFNLDSSLLAGFKFKIGDEVYDNSLRASLEKLKTN
jgi:F0F1-type ATP synthase delta subunit